MIISLCRIQRRSHSITSGTLMSRPSLVFCSIVPTLTTTTDGRGFHIGVCACMRVYALCMHAGIVSRAVCNAVIYPATTTHGRSAPHQKPTSMKRGIAGSILPALSRVRRFNWRSPMKHSSTSKMNYHRDTHVFTDDKDIFHVVNPPGARLRSTMHSRVIQYLPWNYVHSPAFSKTRLPGVVPSIATLNTPG